MMTILLLAAAVLVPEPQSVTFQEGALSVKGAKIVETRDKAIAAEGYRLTVTPAGIRIASSDEAGAFYARQTLSQLESGGKYPCCTINDFPAYRWRGMMIDEGRHFLGKTTVKRVIDLMALHKMNTLHWHLTEDQGWRIDIKGRPELVRYGSVRPESVKAIGWRKYAKGQATYETDGEKYGPFYYTEGEIREIVAYAKAHHVTIVPEIEFPGHVRAFLAAYPEYSCVGASLPRIPRVYWSIEDEVLCIGNDAAVAAAESILDAVCELFPDSPYIHIGGDECPRKRWTKCPKCQARMKKEGLAKEADLQSWLTTRLAKCIERHGKRAVGWDEVLAGKVPTSTIGMTWRSNAKGGAGTDYVSASEAVLRGHDMVMTPLSNCYLSIPSGLKHDPYTYLSPGNKLPLEKVYAFDPVAGLPPEGRSHVLGGQASVWGEYVWNRYDLEWKTWPRACAIAEALWRAPDKRDFPSFRQKIAAHRLRLLDLKVNCAPLDGGEE